MRVLHAAYASDPATGVVRQMAAEQMAAERLGLDWSARFFVPAGTRGDICVQATASPANRIAFKREYYRWLHAALQDVDVLLLRYLRYDPFQLRFMMQTDKPVFLVHHTLEGPQISQEGGRSAALKLWLDNTLARRCHARAAGLVAVTEEIADYERARGIRTPVSLLYPNGIPYDILPENEPLGSSAVPELLFIASRFVDWHGLDLLLDAAGRSQSAVKIHIVGELSDEQCSAVATDQRFVAHGTLPLAAVEILAAGCTLGLGSFALHRKDMRQGCTLKVREYLLAGLPVFAGHADVFDATFRWYRHGACDIDAMLDYARECGGVSRLQVANDARPWIDKARLVEKLYLSLVEQSGTSAEKSP